MPSSLGLVIAVVAAAVAFDFINGFHDTANAIATTVSTRALPMSVAIGMSAALNLVGATINTAVAHTIGAGIAEPSTVTLAVILASLLGAIVWNLITWYYGIPSSSSHALIGGIVGAVIVAHGVGAVKFGGLAKIGLSLVISPIVGLGLGFVTMLGLSWVFHRSSPHTVNKSFARLQILSAAFMSFSHGSNDAQKTMGIISMALVSAGFLKEFAVPTWVVLTAALAMAAGTSAGGLRIIKTMGLKMFKLKPIHGFAAETSAAATIITATAVGLPVSTTHVISTAVMGVGASQRLSAVRWGIAGNIFWAWVLTIPASALVAGLVYKILTLCGLH